MKRAFTLVEMLIAVAGVALLLLVGVPYVGMLRRGNVNARRASCQSNLYQLGLAFMQYNADYDDHFPLVATGGSAFGWADAVQPYVRSTQVLQCPEESTNTPGTNPCARGYTDYWFNANLSGRRSDSLWDSETTIMLGDGNYRRDRTDSRYALKSFPFAWLHNDDSPLHRHLDGAVLCFTKGTTTRWFSADKFSATGAENVSLLLPTPTPKPKH